MTGEDYEELKSTLAERADIQRWNRYSDALDMFKADEGDWVTYALDNAIAAIKGDNDE